MDKGLASASISILSQPPSATTKPINSAISQTGNADNQVRVVSLEEYKEAALCLAEAFKDDHTTDYFVNTPDRADWTEKQKWDLHVNMMEYITYAHCLKGLVTTVGPNYGAVALW
jgi:hypothetical protein